MKHLKNIPVIILAGVLAATLGCSSTTKKEDTQTNKRESAGEYFDDTVITTKVKAAILNESTLKSSEIHVETYKGVVQLSGFVNSETDMHKAVEVARGVKGVVSVKDDMRLKVK